MSYRSKRTWIAGGGARPTVITSTRTPDATVAPTPVLSHEEATHTPSLKIPAITTTTTTTPTSTSLKNAASSLKKPATPSLQNPATPSLQNPATPSLKNPATPSLKNPTTPSLKNPAAPSLKNPATPSVKNPTTPSLKKPVVTTTITSTTSSSLKRPLIPSVNNSVVVPSSHKKPLTPSLNSQVHTPAATPSVLKKPPIPSLNQRVHTLDATPSSSAKAPLTPSLNNLVHAPATTPSPSLQKPYTPLLKNPNLTPTSSPSASLKPPSTLPSTPSFDIYKQWGPFKPITSKPTIPTIGTSSSGKPHAQNNRPLTRASQSSMLAVSKLPHGTSGSQLRSSQISSTSAQPDKSASVTNDSFGGQSRAPFRSSLKQVVGSSSSIDVNTVPHRKQYEFNEPITHVLDKPIVEDHRKWSRTFEHMSGRAADVTRDTSPMSMDDINETQSHEQSSVKSHHSKIKRVRLMKPRRVSVPEWSNSVEFSENEEVLTIDADGAQQLVSGSVLPRHVWNDKEGVRYYVHFNKYNQPVKKGASILISFLGDIAKKELFCPIGVKSWHKLHTKIKSEIIRVVRAHFIIPDGETFNKGILMRVAKNWRYHKHTLKNNYDPDLPVEKNYEAIPDGVSVDNWIHLVDYWNSEFGQKLSEIGKAARESQTHVHTSGVTSFANRRADFEEENGREPSELEFFKSTNARNDGSFIDGTLSAQFLEHADAKVDEIIARSSPSKSRLDIDKEVFEDLMYEEQIPKRPVNYGFGVKQSDIFGVEGELRKSGSSTVGNNIMDLETMKAKLTTVLRKNEELTKQNEEMGTQFAQTTALFKSMFQIISLQMAQVLNAVREGKVTDELLDGAQSALGMVNLQVPHSSSDHDGGGSKSRKEPSSTNT